MYIQYRNFVCLWSNLSFRSSSFIPDCSDFDWCLRFFSVLTILLTSNFLVTFTLSSWVFAIEKILLIPPPPPTSAPNFALKTNWDNNKNLYTVRPWDARFLGSEKICVAQNSCNLSYFIGWWQNPQKTSQLKVFNTKIRVSQIVLDPIRKRASARSVLLEAV